MLTKKSWIIAITVTCLLVPVTFRALSQEPKNSAPLCPRCGTELVIPPSTAEPQGEGDDLLCRWDLQSRNPYSSLFAYCPRCGFTVLREHLSQAAALHAATARLSFETIDEGPLKVVHLARNAFLVYTRESVPERARIKALWIALCALHRAPLPYPEASWNREVNSVWQRMRALGLQDYPVWRWYEALGHYFLTRWQRTGSAADGLLALDFFRRIGRVVHVKLLQERLASQAVNPNLQQWLDWQARYAETAERLQTAVFTRETTTVNRCQPPWIALLMVRFAVTAYHDQADEARATLETLRACPTPDPILFGTYLAPMLRRVWTLRPAWRTWLEPWLNWNPYAESKTEPSQR